MTDKEIDLDAGPHGAAGGFTTVGFDHMLAIGGLQLPPHRVVQAVDGFGSLADGLDRLREVTLPFLADVPEPAAANRWIEEGGRS